MRTVSSITDRWEEWSGQTTTPRNRSACCGCLRWVPISTIHGRLPLVSRLVGISPALLLDQLAASQSRRGTRSLAGSTRRRKCACDRVPLGPQLDEQGLDLVSGHILAALSTTVSDPNRVYVSWHTNRYRESANRHVREYTSLGSAGQYSKYPGQKFDVGELRQQFATDPAWRGRPILLRCAAEVPGWVVQAVTDQIHAPVAVPTSRPG
jgi:hypothetical protein